MDEELLDLGVDPAALAAPALLEQLIVHRVDVLVEVALRRGGRVGADALLRLPLDDPGVVRRLIGAGADVNALADHYEDDVHSIVTPLVLAVDRHCDDTVELLVDAGAKLDARAIAAAVERQGRDRALRFLLARGCPVPHWVYGHITDLDLETIKVLIEFKRDRLSISPRSVRKSSLDKIQLLIKSEVREGCDLVWTAVEHRRNDILDDLLLRGFFPSPASLLCAVEQRREDVALQLLTHGADPTENNSRVIKLAREIGMTALLDEIEKLSPNAGRETIE